MKTIRCFLAHLDLVQQGGAWHGPSVSETLAGVDAAAAAKRPIAGAHTILEIVHHLGVTYDLVKAHFRGEDPGELEDWPEFAAGPDEETWKQELAKLAQSQRALRETIAGLADGVLGEKVPGKEWTYADELIGLFNHDTYHAGQIAILRKAS